MFADWDSLYLSLPKKVDDDKEYELKPVEWLRY